ncbi:hypothetical protein SLEP1_g625 [Rubroshorea leprosula]|nr:hypothetical protein SLEP1_g625 [Rubroshorea leprosula]
MELSFTQGHWRYEHWGGFDPILSCNAKPPGVELWAVFEVFSGLFCSRWGFPPASSNLRYGTLPCEAVCTENLAPWLKVLPCEDKAGLSALMDRPSIYRGFYHSQQLHLVSTGSGLDGVAGITLEQTLTVLQPSGRTITMSRNIYLHFDRGLMTGLKNCQKGNKNSEVGNIASVDFLNPGFELSVNPQTGHLKK